MSKYQLTAFDGEEAPVLTTISTGEEGGLPITTHAIGEEGPVLTTLAVGEEDPTTSGLRAEEDGPVLSTSRTGEEDLIAPGGTTENPFGGF